MEKKSTNTDLVADLQKRNAGDKYNHIIKRAKQNMYHDFKQPDGIMIEPKSLLLQDLQPFPELMDIKENVITGVYDESPDYSDCMKMRNDIIENSGENSPMLSMLQLTLEDLAKRFPDSLNSDHHE